MTALFLAVHSYLFLSKGFSPEFYHYRLNYYLNRGNRGNHVCLIESSYSRLDLQASLRYFLFLRYWLFTIYFLSLPELFMLQGCWPGSFPPLWQG